MHHPNHKEFTTQTVLNWVIISLIVILLVLGAYYLSTKKSVMTPTNTLQALIPSATETFDFTTIHGEPIHIQADVDQFHIKGIENKLLFLKVFGWDCQYCKKEIPELIKLKRDLSDSFEVLAIEAQQFSKKKSLQYSKEFGINYPIIAGDDYFDFFNYLKANYAWNETIPLTIVISQTGKILAFEVGAKSYGLSELLQASLVQESNH